MTAVADWLESMVEGQQLGTQAARVVKVLSTQPQLAAYASGASLARRAGVNVATVVRVAQQLGFPGWPALRVELRSRYLASLSGNQVLAEHADAAADPLVDAIRQDIENLQTLVKTVDREALRSTAEALDGARRVAVVASGSFAAPGLQLVHIGTTMGREFVLERHGGTQLANLIARLDGKDVLVVFNFWWTPTEIRNAVHLAFEQGVCICVITDRHTSPLAEVATHLLIAPSEGISAFASLTGATALVHALLAELARRGGDSTRQCVQRTETLWERMGLFDEGR